MLPEQNWRADAIVRLLISIFICIYAGSLASSAVHYFQGGKADALFAWVAGAGFISLAAAMFFIRSRLTLENLFRKMGATLGFFYLGLMLGMWAHKIAGSPKVSVISMIISALAFQGAVVALVVIFLREQGLRWRDSFGWAARPLRAVLIGIGVGLVFLPIGWTCQMLTAEIIERLPGLQFKASEQVSVQTLRMASSLLHKTVLAITTILLAPAAEELLFRGVLYKWIQQLGYPNLAVWGLSIVFAAIHVNALTFPALFLLSLILTILYERTGNLLAPITAHASFNAANFSLLYWFQHGI